MQSGFDERAFVDDYIHAFEALDGHRIAQFYNVPCISVRGDGSTHGFVQRNEIENCLRNVFAEEGIDLHGEHPERCGQAAHDIDGISIYVYDGGSIELPAAIHYDAATTGDKQGNHGKKGSSPGDAGDSHGALAFTGNN